MHSRFPAILLPVVPLAAAVLAVTTGCRTLPPSKPQALWTPEETHGALVFQQKCSKCHYPTSTRSLKGPGLQAITKVGPYVEPPSDDYLEQLIEHGRQQMPAAQLTPTQLHDLLAYLHTL